MLSRVLAPYVASVTAYDVTMAQPGIHRGLPSTTMTVVLAVDDPLDISWATSPEARHRGWSSVAGLHSSHAQIHHGHRQSGVQLELTPAGARALLGHPVSQLHGHLLQLEDLGADPRLLTLPEELAETTDRVDRGEVVAHRLVEVLADSGAPGPRAEVGHALSRLARGVTVQGVADETGYSRRHLANLFRAECGLGPKEFQRIARFQAACTAWSRALSCGTGTLADVAARCGYSDQAHLTRDWVALAGCTPTTWAREEFPFVQDPVRLEA